MSEPIFKDVRFDALRNALYHTERANFLDLVNRSINFLVIILSAGVVAKSAELFRLPGYGLELAVVAVATAQLLFDFGGRARDHNSYKDDITRYFPTWHFWAFQSAQFPTKHQLELRRPWWKKF